MSRTLITAQSATNLGLHPTLTTGTADGLSLAYAGDVILFVHNADSATHTITIPTPATVNGLAIEDKALTISVVGGSSIGNMFIGPFGSEYKQAGNLIYVDFETSESAHFSVAAIKVEKKV